MLVKSSLTSALDLNVCLDLNHLIQYRYVIFAKHFVKWLKKHRVNTWLE